MSKNWLRIEDAPAAFLEFRALADEFSENPTLENYCRLRRRFHSTGVEAARFFSGIDPLFAMQDELTRHGISPHIVAGAIAGDDHELDELCLLIMEALRPGR